MPVRYDRNLMATTLKTMKRVLEIRNKRGNQFIRNRLRGADQLEKQKQEMVQTVKTGLDFLVAPGAVLRKEMEAKLEVVEKSLIANGDAEMEE